MLRLSLKNQIAQAMPDSYKYIDLNTHNYFYPQDDAGSFYITPCTILGTLAPLFYNNIPFKSNTSVFNTRYITDEQLQSTEYLNSFINEALIETDVEGINLLTLYLPTNKIDLALNYLIEDYNYECLTDELENYVIKATEQLKTRVYSNYIRAKIIKKNNKTILITNFYDYAQLTYFFLFVGLIPKLYPEYLEVFSDIELDYFNEMLHRSQLKRIVNSDITEKYINLFKQQNYINKENDLIFNGMLNRLIENKTIQYKRLIELANEDAQSALKRYDQALENYNKASKGLTELESNAENILSEFKTALAMTNIVEIEPLGNDFYITFKVPATFYDIDEAECYIRNINDEKVKQLYTDVFLNQTYKINLISKFWFSIDSNNQYRVPGTMPKTALQEHQALFNPHLEYFSCLGDYKPQLINMFREQNIVVYNNLAIASTKSINFRDGAVMNRWKDFFENILNKNNYDWESYVKIPCLEDNEGNLHTLEELYMPQEEPQVIEVVDL